MEGILKFKLPKDAIEFKIASESMHLYTVLLEIDEIVRRVLKYNVEPVAGLSLNTNRLRIIVVLLHIYPLILLLKVHKWISTYMPPSIWVCQMYYLAILEDT